MLFIVLTIYIYLVEYTVLLLLPLQLGLMKWLNCYTVALTYYLCYLCPCHLCLYFRFS